MKIFRKLYTSILGVLFIGILFSPFANTYADTSTSSGTKVIVTERIPGANCTCAVDNRDAKDIQGGMSLESQCFDPATRKYECEVGSGLAGFQAIFQEIVRWVVYISMLLGVLAIAGAGILWTFGSDSEEYTKKAKGWVMNILIGLIILFTFRYILGFLAPWIFQ